MALFREQADVSVRPAVAGDEQPIADIQLEAWRTAHADVLGEPVLTSLDRDAFAAGWNTAISAPPGPGHRVLVACDGPHVVGFVAIRPLHDDGPDASSTAGEVVALEVLPSAQRGGHGSRLLAAAVDLLREDGLVHVATWVLDGDTAREQFLTDAGLGPDGAARALATGIREVVERRWVAEI
ncbi:MAG TPA: GNAT family N-acetyltransferase [Cellulomonadaceae bacterium]|nr:GNAT family N-acetyltransferase [Cellulomonadaceae bacterium]